MASTNDIDKAFERVASIARSLDLPELTFADWYGTPGIKVSGKGIARIKDLGTLVLLLPMADKELLMQTAADIYFETDHYKGWPAVLIRLAVVSDEELALRISQAWRAKASKRALSRRQSQRSN